MILSFMRLKAWINGLTRGSPLCHPSSFLKNWITAWNRLVAVILYMFCFMIGAFPTPLKRTTTLEQSWSLKLVNRQLMNGKFTYPWKNLFSCMFRMPLLACRLPDHYSDSMLEGLEHLAEGLYQGFQPCLSIVLLIPEIFVETPKALGQSTRFAVLRLHSFFIHTFDGLSDSSIFFGNGQRDRTRS